MNLNEERQRILKRLKRNPRFVYPELPLKRIKAFIERINRIENSVECKNDEELIQKRMIEELSLKLKLLLARGTHNVTRYSERLYGCSFASEFINQAKTDSIIDAQFIKYENITPAGLIKEIKQYLLKYSRRDWHVELSGLTDFYIRVAARERRVLVSRRFNWDFTNLDNTLAHEIDGHVVRAINARKQEKKIFKTSLPFYLKTEEGLASFLGDYCSTASNVSRKHHALKYLAGHLALKEPFSKIYEYFLDFGFTPDLAFQRAFRLKRGFEDTSCPGCFMKEAVYYEGMLEVKGFLDSGGDAVKLYSGKFGLWDLEFTPIPEDVIVPDRLKVYLDSR